jgi:hypothetical protein
VLTALGPQAGELVVDCTVGWAGHAVELLRQVGPQGRLLGIDFDSEHLPVARERLEAVGFPFSLHHGNFAGLAAILAAEGFNAADMVLADLGMSSMQVDDPERGFSYVRDGTLDMRMDRSRGRTAADSLATLSEKELALALHDSAMNRRPRPSQQPSWRLGDTSRCCGRKTLFASSWRPREQKRKKRLGSSIPHRIVGTYTPLLEPFKPYDFWSTANCPTSSSCYGFCPMCCGLAAEPPSSVFTAAKIG